MVLSFELSKDFVTHFYRVVSWVFLRKMNRIKSAHSETDLFFRVCFGLQKIAVEMNFCPFRPTRAYDFVKVVPPSKHKTVLNSCLNAKKTPRKISSYIFAIDHWTVIVDL